MVMEPAPLPDPEHYGQRPFILDMAPLDGVSDRDRIGGVQITRTLLTSGLLQALPAQDLKNPIFLLAFSGPHGLVRPSTVQLTQAMHTTEAKVRLRMNRLTSFIWQGRSLVREFRQQSGDQAYMLN